MSILRALLLLLLAGSAFSQGTLRLLLPECITPEGTVQLRAVVELEPGATLKSFDVRLQFDPARIAFTPAQLAQGPWFGSGGPTFFIGDVIGNQLIVNAAILGPGLSVSGSGDIFTIPVTILEPGIVDLAVSRADMFDVTLQPLEILTVPAASESPCTDFNLGIEHQSGQVLLSWDAQPFATGYSIYQRPLLGTSWQLQDSTTTTQWLDNTGSPLNTRLYHVRSRYTPGP